MRAGWGRGRDGAAVPEFATHVRDGAAYETSMFRTSGPSLWLCPSLRDHDSWTRNRPGATVTLKAMNTPRPPI